VSLVTAAGCFTLVTPPEPEPEPARTRRDPAPVLRYEPIHASQFEVGPGPLTVESNIMLSLYTWFHAKDYTPRRVEFPSHDPDQRVVVHWLLPPGEGPHPTVIVFPILAGSHVVSEALAKALVNNGLAVARLERQALEFETAEEPEVVADALALAVRDARRLLDWLETRPEVDTSRLAAAGISLGGIMACLLQGVDPRIGAGFFMLTGGGLAEIIHDSTEKPVRAFRNRLLEKLGNPDRDEFIAWLRPYTEEVEPLRYAGGLDASRVYLASGRFDRVIHPARTEALWHELGEPDWTRLPVGHYQGLPFLWWTVSRAVEHLDDVFAE